VRIEGTNPIKLTNPISDKTADGQGFADYLTGALGKLDELQRQADISSIGLATGDIQNLHQVMIDTQKAEIALQFTLQIRNKIIDAYQEIMRMQI
jgi:flagellar hook-basal body complex protein FliE